MKTYKSKIQRYKIVSEPYDQPKAKIGSSSDIYKNLVGLFEAIDVYEEFYVLLLNQAYNTKGVAKISQGGIAGTVVDVTLIAKYAVESLSKAVILCHNHPSGTLRPSEEDRKITKKVKEALSLFDIRVVDHLIVTPEEGKYFSFADEEDILD